MLVAAAAGNDGNTAVIVCASTTATSVAYSLTPSRNTVVASPVWKLPEAAWITTASDAPVGANCGDTVTEGTMYSNGIGEGAVPPGVATVHVCRSGYATGGPE